MKQVKHYNGFIHYTKYKSSGATWNTNEKNTTPQTSYLNF